MKMPKLHHRIAAAAIVVSMLLLMIIFNILTTIAISNRVTIDQLQAENNRREVQWCIVLPHVARDVMTQSGMNQAQAAELYTIFLGGLRQDGVCAQYNFNK